MKVISCSYRVYHVFIHVAGNEFFIIIYLIYFACGDASLFLRQKGKQVFVNYQVAAKNLPNNFLISSPALKMGIFSFMVCSQYWYLLS